MKKSFRILSLLLALLFTLSVFTACEIGGQTAVGKEMVTIQWVQGQKLLKEEVVEKGTKLTSWTPEVEGMEFQGWYERPYIKRFDFDKAVTKSMRIYAYFKATGDSGEVETVIPDWYLIGAGKGDLNKANNWNHEDAAKNLGLYAGEDGIYKITLSLYAGDQFKMTKDFGWDAEMAIDKMAGYADGSVKDANGNVVFTAGENNNFVVADGMDGKYEITYDPNTMLMGFTFLESLESMPDDIRLIGDFNGWSETYGEDEYKFTSTDNENWTYTWEVASTTTFKLFNAISRVYYPGGMGNDLSIEPGTYVITFNSNTRNIVVTDEDGNEVDVGFTGSSDDTGTTVTPNADPVEKVYVVLNSSWNDGSKMGAWAWPGDMWLDFTATEEENVYEVSIPTGVNMIIFVDFNAEATEYSWDAKREQTGDLAVPDKSDDKIYYHIATASWSNSSESTGSDSGSGSVGDTATTEEITVYFQNNWLWTEVACHYWGAEGFEGSEWPGAAMTNIGTADGYEVYSITLPVGTTGFLFTGIKNDGSGDTDQSPDLGVDGLVDGQGYKMVWNGSNAVESFTYDSTACSHSYENGVCTKCGSSVAYTIAGTGAHLGTEWDVSNTANDMEYDSETGVFKKVYTNVALGDYEFKIVKDHSWAVNWGDGGQGGGNVAVNVPSDGATLTIIFDGSTITYEVE